MELVQSGLEVLGGGADAGAGRSSTDVAAGAPSVIIANAGESQSGPFEELPADALDRVFQVNVLGQVDLVQRLLPSIYIESEIGQADKHVLKNVTRVERFIQDVIRKTVEEELVFPNFQTFCLGE